MQTTAIVLSPEQTDYRKVAQRHWGLTDEQMKGMHVHHHPPRSEGGRNIPEHLYVSSPSMHAHGWHDGDWFVENARKGCQRSIESRRANPKPKRQRLTPEERRQIVVSTNKARAGKKYRQESTDKMSESHRKTPRPRENIQEQNTAQWVDPNHPELGVRTVSALVRMQRARGLPCTESNRVKLITK